MIFYDFVSSGASLSAEINDKNGVKLTWTPFFYCSSATLFCRRGGISVRVGCVAKTPGAQNGVRVAFGAPGAAVIWRTGSAQSALQVSLSGNHCSRWFWGCNLRSACNLRIWFLLKNIDTRSSRVWREWVSRVWREWVSRVWREWRVWVTPTTMSSPTWSGIQNPMNT